MKTATKRSLATILLSAFLLSACGDSNNNGAASAPPAPISRLYIANSVANSILSYDNAGTVTGNVAPNRTITGASTTIAQHYSQVHDSRTNTLIAGVNGGIAFFDNAVATTGNVAPSRLLTGASTGLGGVVYLALDESRNLLYAVSSGDAVIRVFANAGTTTGNVAPVRTITGAATLVVSGDKRIDIDTTNDRLYLINSGGQLLVFNAASTATGNVAPNRNISGALTTFSFIWGLKVDVGRNLIYVADQVTDAINVFANADTATGNIAPTRRIVGATTGLIGPGDVFVDTSSDTLYVADASGNAVRIWNTASTATGNLAPNRVIAGAATTFNYNGGIVGAR